MNWPFVSRERYDLLQHNYEEAKHVARQDAAVMMSANEQLFLHLKDANARFDKLFDAYHALRVAGANPVEPVAPVIEIPEPDVPPDAVMAAIQQISPTRDATYDANWRFWEKNKAKAAEHPQAFAEEILEGAVFEPDVSVMWPDTKAVE